MNKLTLLLLIFVLLLVSLVVAPPPASPFDQASGGDQVIEIKFPTFNFLKTNEDRIFSFHLFNKSDGTWLDNNSVFCEFHLYNSTGVHINTIMDVSATGGDIFDFEVDIPAANLSSVGDYSFVFQCNHTQTTMGGFAEHFFRATTDGEVDTKIDTSSGISSTIFILFITIMLFIFPLLKTFSKFEWADRIIKRGFWTVGLFVLMWNASILSTIAENANLDIVSHMFRYMILFGWVGYFLAGYMVIKSILELLTLYKTRKNDVRFGDKDD